MHHLTVSFAGQQQEPQPLIATALSPPPCDQQQGYVSLMTSSQQPAISGDHGNQDGCFPSLGLAHRKSEQSHTRQQQQQQASLAPPGERRITIWNKVERRKISGNAAPMGKNVEAYLRKHPECEVFTGQDKFPSTFKLAHSPEHFSISHQNASESLHQPHTLSFSTRPVPEKRITIWHTKERRKISGNAAPMGKNLDSYLKTHPECEVYTSQDKGSCCARYSTPLSIPEPASSDVFRATQDLTPVDQLSEMENLIGNNCGIPISPVVTLRTPNNRNYTGIHASPVSPLDSIPDSFSSVMEFSVGSHGDSACQRWSINSRTPEIRRKTTQRVDPEDSDEEMGTATQNQDEFCVLGQLEGI